MEALAKDLQLILRYEFDYVRQRHIHLLASAKVLLKEIEGAREDLSALGETLQRVCDGEEWPFETPLHPRLERFFEPTQEKSHAS